jgi:hypothetical protein
MSEALKKGNVGKATLKIMSAGEMGKSFKIIRIQLEGMAGSGKSHFLLAIVRHMHEVMGIPLDDILCCLIDCDKQGIAPLLFSEVIPREYQERIQYAKCDNIWQVYDAFKIFDEQLIEHKKKTGRDGWLMVENMGAVWYFCQRDYVEAAYRIPYTQLLLERQEEAYARGKKTLPVLDQMLDYRNINPLHNEFANKITRGEYNTCWTAHTTTRTSQEGDTTVEKVVGGGQKDNDTRVDFILRLYNDKGRFYIDSRKLRSLENTFNQLPTGANSFTSFIEKYEEMLKKDCKKKGVNLPPFFWSQKQSNVSIATKEDKTKAATKHTKKATPERKEEEEEENDDGTIEL